MKPARTTATPDAVQAAEVTLSVPAQGEFLTLIRTTTAAVAARMDLTIDEVAAKIGSGRRAVADAEHGKATTAMAVYAALLWTYDLLDGLERLADPAGDAEGVILARSQGRSRSRRGRGLDNDF